MTRRRPASPRAVAAIAALSAIVGLAAPGLVSDSGAQAPADAPTAAFSAATWLAGQATNNAFSNAGVADWGLTSDAALAYAAAGLGPTVGAATVDQLKAHVAEYVSPLGGADRAAGPLAKVLVVAAVQGVDVTSFGGWNLRAELLALANAVPGDVNLGRIQSKVEPDASNGFSQALAVIGLARTGSVPADVVTYLLHQQCPDGGFRLFFTGGGSCTMNTQSDPDTTGLAVQALLGVGTPAATQAAATAVTWLVDHQVADGSFKGSGPTGSANANSTGLAAQGLRAAGRSKEAGDAAGWLRSLQVACEVTAAPLVADRGAIAYSTAIHTSTVADGAIGSMYRDQFRRATAQAVLGMVGGSLFTMTAGAAPPGVGPFDCTTPTSTVSTSSTSSTSSASTTTPSGGAGSSTTTSTTSTTIAGSTTTSTTSTTSTSTTSSTPTTSTAPASTVTIATRVLANTTSSSGSSGTSGLAVTGGDIGRFLAWSLLAFAVGVGLLGLRRRAR